jgi:PAS domain S-box-containing protein
MTAARTSLHLESGLLSAILEESPGPVFLFDCNGSLALANATAADLVHASKDELIGRTFDEMFFAPGSAATLSFADLCAAPAGLVEVRPRHNHASFSRVVLRPRKITDTAGQPYLVCFASLRQRRNADTQRILAEISSAIVSVQPLSEILQAVVRLTVDIVKVDHATITLVDDTEQYFVVEHEYPPRAGRSLVGERIAIAGQIQEGIFRDKKPVIAPDLASHAILRESTRVAELTEWLGNKSLAIIPMVYKNRVIGTISIDSLESRRTFDSEELEICETIANQAAVAIQNARLTTMYADAYSAFSLARVAERILIDVRNIVDCRKASVQLIVSGRRVLLGGYGFEKDTASPRLLGRVEYDPLVKKIVDSQQMYIIADTRDVTEWTLEPETKDVRSWLGMPLVCAGKPVALVTLDHDEAGYYAPLAERSNEQRVRLEQYAAKAAVEINDAYHFDAARHQVQAFALVNRVADIVGRKLHASELMQEITSEIAQSLGCNACKILLVDSRGHAPELITRAAWPPPTGAEIERVSVAFPEDIPLSPIVQAFRTEKRVSVSAFADPSDSKDFVVPPEVPPDTQSMIVVPIKIADQMIGMLAASHDKVNFFGESDALLLETLASHTGTAIERDTGLELVQRVGGEILRASGMQRVLEEIVAGSMELTRTDSGVIYTLNEDATQIDETFCPRGSEHPTPRMDKEDGITRTVIREKNLIEIVDISADPRVNPGLKERFKSMFAIPLTLDERVIGVLYLNARKARGLTDTERTFLRTLADQAAIFIQRTTLDEQIRTSEAMYHTLVDQSPDSIVLQKEGLITMANPAALRLFGASAEEKLKGRSILEFIHPDDLCIARDRIERATAHPLPDRAVELRVRRGEEIVRVSVHAKPLPGDTEVQVVFHDHTRVTTLLDEMHHRVRRALNVVSGFLEKQEPLTPDPVVLGVFRTIRLRIDAMSTVHTLLERQNGRRSIPVGEYFEMLTEAVLKCYQAQDGPVTCEVRAARMMLDESRAVACGLIVTELVSNSLLHAFGDDVVGRIHVGFTHSDGHYTLEVSDDGRGFAHAGPKAHGGGMTLVNMLASRDLRGSLTVKRDGIGVTAKVAFPGRLLQ